MALIGRLLANDATPDTWAELVSELLEVSAPRFWDAALAVSQRNARNACAGVSCTAWLGWVMTESGGFRP